MVKLQLGFLILTIQIGVSAFANPPSWTPKTPATWISTPLKAWAADTKSCLLYPEHWILEVVHNDRVGNDYFIFDRDKKDVFPEACGTNQSKALISFTNGDYGDVSLTGDLLFLDSGTGNVRILKIVSLKTKKTITTAYYYDAGTFSVKDGKFAYEGLLSLNDEEKRSVKVVKKCKWGSQHEPREYFQENFRGKLQIDLKTGKQVFTEVRCDIGPSAD